VYDPRFLSTYPITDGPRKPPKFPIELIMPTLPAAADEVRNKLGNAQNAGIYDFIPAAAIEKQIIDQ
jgi:hypothetical protein